MRLWKKRDAVRDLVFDHLACVRTALLAFQDATRAYFVDGDRDKAAEFALATHRAEGKADDIRRTVEKEMITGALLPPSRRQILEVIERADTLANAAEASLDSLLLQQVQVPEAIIPAVLDILTETLGLYEEVEVAIKNLFAGKPAETLQCTDRIEQAEGRVDHLERDALKQLFAMDIDLAEKLHVAGYLADLVKISDRGEDLSDRIALIVAERAY
ncbi:DUF47 family protein [Candidatus Bipolaricaulota bacterium]|jgi:predicted phosphate transport protein (TIGR00153 family)|nr:DUF47 family protein [Candidatus Bipolaricaulota bacterium]